ncbi:MAG: SDR family oxidoreductase [Gammaproteobacteria bacterium]|nr:SDR family oxidoreductase [Gammaproteobacteria bacterium]MDH4253652.1 SDR family oxidoreductase [Gammaproteobacteria bacterium]MDH5309768.1 SDR family oxidoreductase [Gammaproteobacteria bacterium]
MRWSQLLGAAVLAALFGFGSANTQAEEPGSAARAVLVTGASSGIGRRTTELLAERGFYVYAGARKQEDLDALDAIDNVAAVRLDVTVQDEIDAAVERIRAEGRGLFGVVNNAGVAVLAPLIELDETDLDFQFDVNVYGPFRISKAFAPLLMESRGRIVNISSISGVLSGELYGAYSMSKHAVEAYTDSLARELGHFDVKVIGVEPGNYSTDIGRNVLQRLEERGYDPSKSIFADNMERMIAGMADYNEPTENSPPPDDVAEAVFDALSSEAPKEHYMVVPVQRQADYTIRKALEEVVRFNEGHRYTLSREQLIAMLDELLAESRR